MFVLRLRDPVRYGKWREQSVFEQDLDAAARRAEDLLDCTEAEAEKEASRRRLFPSFGAFGEAEDGGEQPGDELPDIPDLTDNPDSDADGA